MKNGIMADMGFGGPADIADVPAMCSLMHGLSMARGRRFVQRLWEGKEDEIEHLRSKFKNPFDDGSAASRRKPRFTMAGRHINPNRTSNYDQSVAIWHENTMTARHKRFYRNDRSSGKSTISIKSVTPYIISAMRWGT
jgi:hypothetical protein